MKWFKSIFSRKSSALEPQKQDPELEKAHEWGRKLAGEMNVDLESFMSQRFDGLKERYLGVLQSGLDLAKSSADHSPIIFGRVEYQLFREHVEELKGRMTDEINDHMAGWHKILAEIEMPDGIDELIAQNVKNVTQDIFFAGLSLFLDNADELKEADDIWKEGNPELADEQPLAGEPK